MQHVALDFEDGYMQRLHILPVTRVVLRENHVFQIAARLRRLHDIGQRHGGCGCGQRACDKFTALLFVLRREVGCAR
jgi:hypothetical protein